MFKLGQNYDLLCNMIIRPPRFIYDIADLGPRYFAAGGKPAQRTDFELLNSRGMIIQCSHFEPINNWGQPMPCVIYLHGNGGCRIEALDAVHTLLPADVSVLALDFAGSGLSDGEYVTLGAWEKHDVAAVVQYLRQTNRCSTIGLWGRSMGAVTAILYSMEDPSIASMVLDSPFCSLQKIAEDLVMNIETLQKMPRFTKFAVNLAMKPIRNTIKKKAKFDLKSLEILELVPKCFIPALFVHSKDDNFVLPIHSEQLFEKYSGDKNRVLVEGNHNSMRPNFFMDSAVIFFNNTLHNGVPQVKPNTESQTLPNLPLPTQPQPQAAMQLQQLHEIFHPFHNNNNNSNNNNLNNSSGNNNEVHVSAETQQHPDGNNQTPPAYLSSQFSNVIIDDMVVGNSVIIDGKRVILDEDDFEEEQEERREKKVEKLNENDFPDYSNLSPYRRPSFPPLPSSTTSTTTTITSEEDKFNNNNNINNNINGNSNNSFSNNNIAPISNSDSISFSNVSLQDHSSPPAPILAFQPLEDVNSNINNATINNIHNANIDNNYKNMPPKQEEIMEEIEIENLDEEIPEIIEANNE